jgi:phosphatidylglycerol:prolipoprotein diacylglycerol transferase
MPWGISFVSPACSVIDSLKGIPLHPTQLYEAFGEACAFLFMATWLLPRIRCAKYQYGTAFIGYFLYYAILRFVIEVFRGDDRGLLLSSALSPAQWTSLFAAVIAGVVLLKKGVRERDAARRSLFSD